MPGEVKLRIHKTINTRKSSDRQEKKIAHDIKGRTQIGSGSTPFYKGDVKAAQFLIEAKTKMKRCDAFTIQREWLDTVHRQALASHRDFGALAIQFGPGEKNYYVIEENLFKTLVSLLQEEK